jgi:hypothetical protein
MILGGTISLRTNDSNAQLQGHVASTWGAAQEQAPPTATYTRTETSQVSYWENGKSITRPSRTERQISLPVQASRIRVNFHLDPRQKGLLWYSTYAVEFAADYSFCNSSDETVMVKFRFPFPAQKAVYDGLVMAVNGQSIPLTTSDLGAVGEAAMSRGQIATLHVVYRSQGLDRWRYKLSGGVARVHDFTLVMRTNFKTSTSPMTRSPQHPNSRSPEVGS